MCLRLLFLYFCLLLAGIGSLHAQYDPGPLLLQLEEAEDVEKLTLLQELTEVYLTADPQKAIRYGKQATNLADDLFAKEKTTPQDLDLLPRSYLVLGKAFYAKGRYSAARQTLNNAIDLAKMSQSTGEEEEAAALIEQIDSIATAKTPEWKATWNRSVGKAFRDAKLGDKLDKKTVAIKSQADLKIARSLVKKEDYPKALEVYEIVAERLRRVQHHKLLKSVLVEMAETEAASGNYAQAVLHYREIETILDSTGVEKDASILRLDSILAGSPSPLSDVDFSDSTATKAAEVNLLKERAKALEASGDYKKSLESYKEYVLLQERLEAEKRALLESAFELENKEREITVLVQEKAIRDQELQLQQATVEKQKRTRNELIGGLLLIAGIATSLLLLYSNKRRAHGKLKTAYTDLDETQQQLKEAEQRIHTLLNQQVSGAVATALIDNKAVAVERRFVCILFLDIRDFTPFAEKRTPEEIIAYQNQVFGFMIDIIGEHHGVINQFMGDGFMATFGAPQSHGNDCLLAVNAAKAIVKKVQVMSDSGKIPRTRIGIGMHAGEVVTGNVGTKERMQYSITGNTVILAARIEQLNKQFTSQLLISKEVFDQLPEEDQGAIDADFVEVKVKGRKLPVQVLQLA